MGLKLRSMEIPGSGRQERERFGDAYALSRPAVLSGAEVRLLTSYAR